MPLGSLAHSFGRSFNLPVPFWLYAWGASAALIASFLVLANFAARPPATAPSPAHDRSDSRFVRLARRLRLLGALQSLSVATLMLCVVTGFAGTRSADANFNMTFFWIIFVLGFGYLTAIAGDIYAAINPWRVLASLAGRVFPRYPLGRWRYPPRLGYWPALALYMAFIWLELLGQTGPYSLAWLLVGYSLLNLTGVALVGARDWFGHCEFFGVYFGLIARMAPVDFAPGRPDGAPGRLRWRAPFSGLLDPPASSMGLLLFTLFMLSSTAFDGLGETVAWHRLFWVDLYHGLLQDWVGRNPLAAFPVMTRLFRVWQTVGLVVSPFLYLGVFLGCVALARWAARSAVSVRELALRFGPSLLPIALVYNISHYYTLIQTQGVKIVRLASDPLGRGWDLFGTAQWLQLTIIPDSVTVWHVQVGLIVAGHIVSVWVSHHIALRTFPTPRQALLSQVPMLLLMLGFTTAGLWILSQPLQS